MVCEARGEPLDGPFAQRLIDATLWLYLAVRFQDDLVDGDAPVDAAYLQQVATARAMALLGAEAWRALPVLEEFAEAALADLELRRRDRPWGDGDLAAQGRKFLPMLAPIAALAPELEDEARALILPLGAALQLVNDLAGAHRDLETGQWSGVLQELAPTSAEELFPALRRARGRGQLEAWFAQITAWWNEALDACDRLPVSVLGEHLALRAGHLRQTRVALLVQLTRVPHLTLDMEVTRECNLRCPDCFVFAQEEDLTPGSLERLDEGLAMAVVDEVSGYDTTLHLTGGEPFAWPPIWRLLERASARGIPRVVINTNANFLGPARMDQLAALSCSVSLLISIEGPPGADPRGPGQSQAALKALRRAREHGVACQPGSILSAELLDFGIERWLRWLEGELGAGCGLALWPYFVQAGRGATGAMLGAEQVHRAADELARLHLAGESVLLADYPLINPLLEQRGVPPDAIWRCEAAGRGKMLKSRKRPPAPSTTPTALMAQSASAHPGSRASGRTAFTTVGTMATTSPWVRQSRALAAGSWGLLHSTTRPTRACSTRQIRLPMRVPRRGSGPCTTTDRGTPSTTTSTVGAARAACSAVWSPRQRCSSGPDR